MNRQVSKKNRATVRKPVLIRSELHRRLKLIAFNCDVKLQDLMDAIVETALNDKTLIKEILKELNVKNSYRF
jgi:hypothetical protein